MQCMHGGWLTWQSYRIIATRPALINETELGGMRQYTAKYVYIRSYNNEIPKILQLEVTAVFWRQSHK